MLCLLLWWNQETYFSYTKNYVLRKKIVEEVDESDVESLYLKQKFAKINDVKIKEVIFVGQLINDPIFEQKNDFTRKTRLGISLKYGWHFFLEIFILKLSITVNVWWLTKQSKCIIWIFFWTFSPKIWEQYEEWLIYPAEYFSVRKTIARQMESKHLGTLLLDTDEWHSKS